MEGTGGRRAWRRIWCAAALALAACGPQAGTPPPPVENLGHVSLAGAGATFPEPFYARAFYQFGVLHPGVSVDYQGVGSGMGVSRFAAGNVDFGASDVPLSAAEVTAAGGGPIIQVPAALGPIAIAYNLASVPALRLDGPTLALIYAGAVRRWDDPRLAALNPGTGLPPDEIVVVHRADSSGTTFQFTSFLAATSSEWKSAVGAGRSVSWPTGISGNGNEAVASQVLARSGGIGYVELAYAMSQNMRRAAIRNAAGQFVQPSASGATAAASAVGIPRPDRFLIVNAPGEDSYPISSYSWILVRRGVGDPARAHVLHALLAWLVGDGQRYAAPLGYAPLPDEVGRDAMRQLSSIEASHAP